jgi:hypothetical protein
MKTSLSYHKHTISTTYHHPHIFLQSKGFNAGKPSPAPYRNCYVLFVADELEKNIIYWICYSLWRSGHFNPLLKINRGYELDIDKAAALINETCLVVSLRPDGGLSKLKELRSLIKTEVLLNAQLKMIQHIKRALTKEIVRR